MKTEKIIGMTALLAVAIFGIMVFSYGGFVGNVAVGPSGVAGTSGQEIKYGSAVCVYKNDELVFCKPNTLTNIGKNQTKYKLINFAGMASASYIAVGNGTGMNASSTFLERELFDCNMGRQQDTTAVKVGTGNFSYSYLFQSTCNNLIVNTTALYNNTAATGNTSFAGANFTSSVTLQNGDQLNVTWFIFVTS